MVLLVVLLVAWPIAELTVFIFAAQEIGFLAALLLLFGFSVIGAVVARRQGAGAWRRASLGFGEGRLPTKEVADGTMVLLAGLLLVVPGFITDALGVLLLLPPIRAVVRRVVPLWLFGRRGLRRRPVRTVDGESTSATWGTPEISRPDPTDTVLPN